MKISVLSLTVAGATLASAIASIPASAFTFTGSFKDPLIPSLYPNSMLTGNFSFNSELINAQGFVSSKNINFISLKTSNNPDGFNGTGWSFSPFTPFVFNATAKLFEGVYVIERSCLPGEGCPPNTFGQQIANPNFVFWDAAPDQVVILNPVPEPLTILGSIAATGFVTAFNRIKNKKE
jgi:hypothetical protein